MMSRIGPVPAGKLKFRVSNSKFRVIKVEILSLKVEISSLKGDKIFLTFIT